MKKFGLLLILCSFPTLVKAGNEDLLRRSTDDPFALFGVTKKRVADAVQNIYKLLNEKSVLDPVLVRYIYSANAAFKEGIPEEYAHRVAVVYYDEPPRFGYPLSFQQLLDIWASKQTTNGPAFWQLMANVFGTHLSFYETREDQDNTFETKAKFTFAPTSSRMVNASFKSVSSVLQTAIAM
jgi:hypothetical protein